jgi:acyl-CoA reductase-like NAD-dependent aldehyde dehydrogenase
VNGFGAELGRALVTKKVSKAAFTGSTTTGRLVMQYAIYYSCNPGIGWEITKYFL